MREQGAADHLLTLCGVHAPIMLDPTLLLSGNYWEEMINQAPLVKGEYIFLYTPWYDEQVFLKAEMLSNLLGIKVVIAQIYEKMRNINGVRSIIFSTCYRLVQSNS